MASDLSFVQYVCEQARGVDGLSYRKMFGEYALYAGSKVVALVCDNQLFVRPTSAGRALLSAPVEVPAYPGGSPYFLISDELEEPERLCSLLRATASEVPAPRPKKSRKPRTERDRTGE